MRYLPGQLLLYKAPDSRINVKRPKEGFYLVIGFDGLKALLCPTKPDEEDYISLVVQNNQYPIIVLSSNNRNLHPSCMNFYRKIIPSLIPKNIKT